MIWWLKNTTPCLEAELTNLRSLAAAGCAGCDGRCCEACAAEDGYLRRRYPGVRRPSSRDLLNLKAAHGWTDAAGFRGPAGCLLPVRLRSPTCVNYHCWNDSTKWLTPPVNADIIDTSVKEAASELAAKLTKVTYGTQEH
mgnify:CR=1 FL=1